jgi:hypothetical protein
MMRRVAVGIALVALAGCLRRQPVRVDPDVTVALHRARGGLVVDRLPGGATGTLGAAGRLPRPGAPTYVLRVGPDVTAAFWLEAPATVRVRAGAGGAAIGRVDPEWTDQAIRLTLRPAAGPALRTDTFRRTATGGGPSVLTRDAQSVLDVRGTYRADVRDGAGAAVGWLRVRVGPYLPAPRLYDGVLPDGIDPRLAVAAAAALDSEVDWIEGHTLDVYEGDGGDGLHRSLPGGL